jgi:2-dehydro-3-deoxy-L-rhamnonate dehydrogenase (NAD+)
MSRFSEQVAIITGGASGIGEAVTRRIIGEGGKVVMFNMHQENLERVSLDCGAGAKMVDVSDEKQVERGIQYVLETHKKLDIMINCAGIIGPTSTPIVNYQSSDFQKVMNVNLLGSFFMLKHSLPQMLSQNYGRILLIASISGKEGNPGMVGYSTSKAAVIGLVKAVGKEYATSGVTVNGLAPAVIQTPMNQDTSEEQLRYMLERIPMKRLGTFEEVTSLACWIVSKEASFNTGFIFDLSGGRATY